MLRKDQLLNSSRIVSLDPDCRLTSHRLENLVEGFVWTVELILRRLLALLALFSIPSSRTSSQHHV